MLLANYDTGCPLQLDRAILKTGLCVDLYDIFKYPFKIDQAIIAMLIMKNKYT
jgi:hypothetical protein